MQRKNIRRRKDSDSDDDHMHVERDSLSSLISDIKDVQKMRKKPPGINVSDVQESGSNQASSSTSKTDPFKLKRGGFVDMKKMKHADIKDSEIEEGIKQTFSKESHLRDEDEEMRKYVEDQLLTRKGHNGRHEREKVDPNSIKSTSDLNETLFSMPDRLKTCRSVKNEEMLSNQMLCGIPEVDLGVDAKIKNIEETEAAKLRLLKEALDKRKDLAEKLTARQNLAKDLAKSYVQHSIYKIDETTLIGSESTRAKPKRPKTEPVPVVDEDTPKWIKDGHTVERPDSVGQKSASATKVVNKKPKDALKQNLVRKKC